MATVNYEKIFTEVRGVQVIAWKGLKNGDTGQPYECAPWSDKSVQVSGTFGTGGNCRIEGSLMVSNPAWATLNDAQGNALDITIAQPKHLSMQRLRSLNVYCGSLENESLNY